MTYDVNLGIGNSADSGVTGMFYKAPAGTSLPADAATTPGSAWTEVGAVSHDGITFSPNKDYDDLKNWANKIERQLPSDEPGQVTAPIIYTTEEVMKTIFGANKVTVTAATAQAGKKIKVDMGGNNTPDPQAFLFIMKDGDDMMMIGTTKGFVSITSDISFQPDDAITWEALIKGDWTFMKAAGPTGATGATS